MRLGFNKLPVYVYWETNWCKSRVASFQASPIFILRVVFSIIQFPTTLVYYPTCKLKNKNEAKSRESKREEIMCWTYQGLWWGWPCSISSAVQKVPCTGSPHSSQAGPTIPVWWQWMVALVTYCKSWEGHFKSCGSWRVNTHWMVSFSMSCGLRGPMTHMKPARIHGKWPVSYAGYIGRRHVAWVWGYDQACSLAPLQFCSHQYTWLE